ncbi:MAG: aminotransferase class III-fold pyridoxal phosphate-dependent enzyme, partial [Gammaproteobacteria bacterium]|nr:aminotransferase class III-fold pyridoxal phosphate-dependent enzyme [Gammaproteobacteria bacterium]
MADLLIKKDQQHIWHPCSQMHDYESFQPLIIKKAYGPYLELANGRRVIDAISSWWCKSLGHGHPRLKAALLQQAEQFEHVIMANTTNEIIVELAEQLASLTPGLDKIFFASEGSSAVEIAIKLSLHSRQITGESNRRKVMALQNSYHGETLLA